MEEETKNCPNCKHDIPAGNFTVHSLHCVRNISKCPVCKEPMLQNELQEHHDKMHKLLRCKQCGESVRGSDLEDHVRDSCALTANSCRYCSLELPRRELPPHEAYCGARTEQCAACRQWVMIKYRQLHNDSNHGFLRLDDDPDPTPPSALSNGRQQPAPLKNINTDRSPRVSPQPPNGESTASIVRAIVADNVNGAIPKVPKRTNDQPQINTAVITPNKVTKSLVAGRGAVQKRRAPPPPAPPALESRDRAYYSAELRRQQEERARRELNDYNREHGLPAVLTPAEKVEKLRRLDALQHRGHSPEPSGRLREQAGARGGSVRASTNTNANVHVLGKGSSQIKKEEFKDLKPMSNEQFLERFRELQMGGEGGDDGGQAGGSGGRGERVDRFGEIKSSLSQLRRGLNQIRYTYDNAATQGATSTDRREQPVLPSRPDRQTADEDEVPLPCEFCGLLVLAGDLVQHQTGCRPDLAQLRARPPPRARRGGEHGERDRGEAPLIPCEFCAESLPVYLFSQHLAACRRGRPPASRSPSPSPAPSPTPPPREEEEPPVIPCEFCTESLPVYLFSEHVKRCSGGRLLLYPD